MIRSVADSHSDKTVQVVGDIVETINSIDKSRRNDIAFRLTNVLDNIVSFSGDSEYYCVCLVDLVNSTNITSKLSYTKACMYYGVFLNTMSIIAKEFGATVVKNGGDSLLYYFPKTSDTTNKDVFKKVLECGKSMIELRTIINDTMSKNGLPELNYRISADYGHVMLADSMTSFHKDIFGPTVNICSKINSMAIPNTMVIGGDMYQHVKDIDGCSFKEIESFSIGHKHSYSVYSVLQR